MKEKWKYGSLCTLVLFVGLFLFSCRMKQDKAVPSNKIDVKLNELVLPVNQAVLSSIKTITPTEQTIAPVINAVGVISYDPRLVNNISARYSGRIEKLYVKFNFEEVNTGQRIMDIYSPDMVTEEHNLIFLITSQPPDKMLISSSEQKLKLLGMTDEQLKQLENTKEVINPLPVYSTYSGHIHDIGVSTSNSSMPPSSMNNNMSAMGTEKPAQPQMQIENIPSSQTSSLSMKEGMYIEGGQAIFAVYNTSELWAVLNVYPKDAAIVKVGDSVSITSETAPGIIIHSTVNYIEPVLEANAATIKVRVYLRNEEHYHFRIGALLNAKIFPKGVEGMWVPKDAVVDLGDKKVVFVQKDNFFRVIAIETGIVTGSLIEVRKGLKGDERIASNAQYLVDSESFIKEANNE